ncbi:zeta-carotene-forming phytoene desaturase [Sporomusa silvacetica DSM 10669]|uniref:Zeta-carotene-forming phytoene desaturase n=1 Tax=Sporomusa silvacetica DSM 10669 TaxID=1123289 RepID=A0ABZ3ILF7_9FIRM|nr:NAD(P)/FAD-dependent oxidoreductase [Sporomusa silvacetica]OZC13441.1 zeta-carotene-forming phytoene desaturase [Sporomusa silvacetica DSM 10669]
MNYDVIVIGGGIGGLAFSAVASARLGKKVLLLEKNSVVGGRLSSFKRGGFTLDIGAHVISQSEKGPLGSILRILGKENDISWEHVRPMTSYKNEIFAFPKGLAGRIPDEQYSAIQSTIKEIINMSDSDSQKMDNVDLRTYLKQKGISDPLALACFNNIVMIYVCVPYHRASAGEFIRCFRQEARSRASGYPVGGCGVIAKALADGIEENGALIRTSNKVKEIIVENGQAVGVRTEDAEYRAPVIVSNADGLRTLLDLLPAGILPEKEYSRVQKMTYSYSMLIVRMALEHSVTDLKLITHIVEGLDSRRFEEDLLAGRFPDEMPLFMPVPSNFSSECAPEGYQLITAGAIIPYETPDIERLEEIVVNTAMKILPGLKDALMWRHVTSPAGLHATVVENGAIIGLGQTADQVGKSRLGVETAVPGLYLCGAEAGGSGVGIELAINSAFELFANLGEKDASWKAANNL